MKRFPTLLMLVAPFIFLTAAKERKEALVKTKEPKEALVTKKKGVEKGAPSRKIKIISHTTSIAVPTIIFLLLAYFCLDQGGLASGFFGNKSLNAVIFSFLFSVVGFYLYLQVESFLAKKMPSAIGKFFAGLISFLLSGCVGSILLFIYAYELPDDLKIVGIALIVGFIMSLNSSLFSWWIYTGINWVAERGRKETEKPKEKLLEKKEVEGGEEELVTKKEAIEQRAPSRKIKIISHTTSIAVPTIIFLLFAYFFGAKNDGSYDFPAGFFGNGHVNIFVCSILSSAAGFYFYLQLESFLAKQMRSATGKFFSGLISFLLSGCLEAVFLSIYIRELPKGLLGILGYFIVGLIFSLNSSLFSWWIYTGINRVASQRARSFSR